MLSLIHSVSDDFVTSPICGAIASFQGTTRNSSKDGKQCIGLDYSAYNEMAMKVSKLDAFNSNASSS